ncbi:hypothetical protein AA0498_0980 [Acidomonas methanolica]|uniref:Uncharacterized protein n=1 Tax=Acidomonas methanolica NBRC 104435 TaxID=1231351 RepID=A0A023D3J4_ACIMT|nr:hypothetical protein Amme_021_011 [Acidomonas methanolica NBRC 104435]GBQ49431.1 hypothetical protein AA0498_0980 [Acidomonas methanolica]
MHAGDGQGEFHVADICLGPLADGDAAEIELVYIRVEPVAPLAVDLPDLVARLEGLAGLEIEIRQPPGQRRTQDECVETPRVCG